MKNCRKLSFLLLISLLLASCFPSATAELPTETPAPQEIITLAPTEEPAASPAKPSSSPTETSEPVHFVWVAPYVGQVFRDQLILPRNVVLTGHMSAADYFIEVGTEHPSSAWVFTLVAPFPTTADGVSAEALIGFWKGTNPGLFGKTSLLLDENTYQCLSLAWGKPAEGAVELHAAEDLLNTAWERQLSWAIVPFEALEPRWKVLSVDGITPFDPSFDLQAYPLTVPISIDPVSDTQVPPEELGVRLPASNFDPNQMTQVALTGVTALVRGTAIFMNAKGILYAAEDTGALLRSADITHISNEIPFYSQCPPPEMYPDEIRFCSDPAYYALLEEVGTDVIELTGDHFGDYGVEAMGETLSLYEAKGMPYYGGGATAAEARQAVTFEHHGNRIAFIGCNAKGIDYYASATDTSPGAVACDLDWMSAEVARLKAEGYLVIATFQHIEYDAYNPDLVLKQDLQRIAKAGADIVSGSQAHQPHGMAFLEDAFIHYGLGNLFFDQYRYYTGGELDYGFIDWHIFYAGKYISTRLVTISWVDLAKNRFTTPFERQKFLQTIFNASQWEVVPEPAQP